VGGRNDPATASVPADRANGHQRVPGRAPAVAKVTGPDDPAAVRAIDPDVQARAIVRIGPATVITAQTAIPIGTSGKIGATISGPT